MACRRMRGAAVLCAVAAAAVGWPGVTAAVPAAPELRPYLGGSVDAVRIQRVADVMRNSSEPRFDVAPVLPGEPVMASLWHFLIAPPAGASRERRSWGMRNTWVRSVRAAWS